MTDSKLFSVVLVTSIAAACGGGSGAARPDARSDGAVADTRPSADAAADARIDAPAGPCAMLAYTTGDEPTISEPLSISYPAFSAASVAGQGSNAAHVGYTVGVTYVSGGTAVTYGVYDSDVGEGVPWDDAAGALDDGHVKSFAIDVQGGVASSHKITITFDAPVTALKLAVTDLDHTSESVQVDAFAGTVAGTAVALTDNLLSDPSTYAALAAGAAHSGNDAYLVDQTKTSALGSNRYGVLVDASISDRTGTVLFAYDDATALQRVEVTYTGNSAGVWIAGMQYASLCGP